MRAGDVIDLAAWKKRSGAGVEYLSLKRALERVTDTESDIPG